MKRILFALIAVLLLVGMANAATPGYSSSPGIGEIVQMSNQWDAPKKFRMVRYAKGQTAGDTTLVTESIVVWDTTDDDGITVTTSTTSYDTTVAGIIVQNALTEEVGTSGNTAAEDAGRRNWTWLQTYGYCQVRVGLESVKAAGAAMGTASSAGEAGPFIPSTTDPALQGVAGFFFDTAAAAADDVECFLKCE